MSTVEQVTSAGCTGGLQQICGQRESFQGFAKVWFSDFSGYWRTWFSSDFGEIVLAGRASFSLRIYEFDKVTKHKFVSYVYWRFIFDLVVSIAIFFSQ
jgi:hypothetical protein